MSIKVDRAQRVIDARETFLDPIGNNDGTFFTSKEYFFDRKPCCLVKEGEGYTMHYDCADYETTAWKIILFLSRFETLTLIHLKNHRTVLLCPGQGFTIKNFDAALRDKWAGIYSRGAMLSEIEKAVQQKGIDTTHYDEQQLLDNIDDTILYRAYMYVGGLAVSRFPEGCNALRLPHANLVLQGICGKENSTMTFAQQENLSNQGIHNQMRFLHYLNSLQELSHGSREEIQAEIWEGFQKLEQEKAAEAVRQLLLEEPEEKTVRQPVKKGAKTKSQTTTTTTTTTTKQQAPTQKKATPEPAPTVPKKKAPPVNSAQVQILDKLNAPVIKTRIQCDKRVLRWRGATLAQIRDTFVDKKGEELVKQYASFTDEELKYQQQVHNIPMERILSIPDLQTKYSCSYSFTVNGSQRAGRCFCAIKQNGQATETGLIRVAIDSQTNKIYHTMFEKRDNISLDQLTQNVNHTENVVVEDAQWEQPNKYMFKMEGGTIVMSIQNLTSKEITIYKILPLS